MKEGEAAVVYGRAAHLILILINSLDLTAMYLHVP